MKRINVQTDIKPLSEFRAKMADLVERINKTGQPLVLTQRGKTVAVVMSPKEYEALAYREEFIAAVKEGIAEADAGNLIPHDEVMSELRRRHEERVSAINKKPSKKKSRA